MVLSFGLRISFQYHILEVVVVAGVAVLVLVVAVVAGRVAVGSGRGAMVSGGGGGGSGGGRRRRCGRRFRRRLSLGATLKCVIGNIHEGCCTIWVGKCPSCNVVRCTFGTVDLVMCWGCSRSNAMYSCDDSYKAIQIPRTIV